MKNDMNLKKALSIFARTFGHILQENEGIVTDDIDGTKYFVYKNQDQIKISLASESEMMKSQDYKVGKWIWFYKTKEECIDAIIDDHIVQKEIDGMTEDKK